MIIMMASCCLFNLTTKNPEISIDPNDVITYHETASDAALGANPLASPYCNINPGTQILYVRVHNVSSPSCYSTTTLQLVVNPVPVPKPNISQL